MKVFTVGLDEKPPIKEHPEPENVTVVPPPMIAVEKKIKKSYKVTYRFHLHSQKFF